jgi:osmotically-inducible protein OsmY
MLLRVCMIVCLLLSTSGCTVLAVGGAAAIAASTANDPRTVGRQIDDKTNTLEIANSFSDIPDYKTLTNIDINIYNGQLLLTGQAVNANVVRQVIDIAQRNDYITKVHNQIRIAPLAGVSTQAKDIVIANTIRAKLLADERINSQAMTVNVSAGEVFLMGLVDNAQATAAVEIARNVQNVVRVNRVFEIR